MRKEYMTMGDIRIDMRPRKDGTATYQYRFEIASIDGKRQWKSKSGFKTKREAKEAGKIAQREYERVGQIVEPSDMSYSDFLDMWIETDARISCKDTTIRGYEKKIRLYIKPELGKYRVSSIRKKNLQTFINNMYDEGFSINTISSVKGILSKSFAYAVDNNFITMSPAVQLKTPKNLQPKKMTRKKEHIVLKKEEINKIFERFPKGTTAYIPLLIAYHTGMRLSEIFALVWDDVNFDNKTIKVNRQVQWFAGERTKEEKKKTNGTAKSDGYWYFSEPKYSSYRILSIDDILLKALKEEYDKQKENQKLYDEYYTYYYSEYALSFLGVPPDYKVCPINKITKNDDGNIVNFICRRENGEYVNSRTTQHISYVIHKELNIPKFDMHSFRHTHGTMLIEQGADMVYIQRRLGHKDINVTMNIYTNHVTKIIKDRSDNKLNLMFNEK